MGLAGLGLRLTESLSSVLFCEIKIAIAINEARRGQMSLPGPTFGQGQIPPPPPPIFFSLLRPSGDENT